MSKLRFSDGIEIDASGAMRVVRKSDGYYIVGQGVCCPVDSIEEGQRIISRFMTKHRRVKIESEKQRVQMKDHNANNACKCTICGVRITNRHEVSYRFDFKKNDYTTEIICVSCDEQQSEYQADYIAGDDW